MLLGLFHTVYEPTTKTQQLKLTYNAYIVVTCLDIQVSSFDWIFNCPFNMRTYFLFTDCQVDAMLPSVQRTGLLDLYSDAQVTFC